MAETPTRQFLENSIVVWLNQNSDDIEQSIAKLRQIIHVIKVFNNEQSFINYIRNVIDERILLIVTTNISETTIELIHQLPQIDSIYLFGSHERPNWISNHRKLQSIVNDTESLYQTLRSKVQRTEYENITFNLIGDVKSLSNSQPTNKQEAAFMYTQLLKDIFIEMKDDSKNEIVLFCQEQYADNTYTLQLIDEFKQNYEPNKAINWYTRESFLYKILNKALRTQNIEILYKIRTFIRNLHCHLLEFYHEQNNISIGRILYRGQRMSNNEFKNIENNQGGLLSISNFFSTTEDKSLAMIYAGMSNDDETSMIFEIKIEPSQTGITSPFANIQELSSFGQAEKEWLFSFGSVFRILEIKKGLNNQPWHIHLLLTNEFDQQLKMMTEHFRTDLSVGSLVPLHSLAKLSYKMGIYVPAIEYFLMALRSEEAWRRKIMILKEMGQTYERLARFDNALTCFHKALDIHKQLDGKEANDYHTLAAIYIGIASIYTAKQDNDQSLIYLNKALDTEFECEKPEKDNILNCYNDIAFIYFTQKKYDESLVNFRKAIDISTEIYPAIHPSIGTIYMNIGVIYLEQKSYMDALEYLKKSLDIQLGPLPADHPDIARSFNNISGIYHSMGHYENALMYCKNALNIYLKRMPQNHPNLAILYDNLIELCNRLGQLKESLDYQYIKLDIYRTTLQPDDTKIGISYNTIAATLAALRRFDEATEYAMKAVEFTTRIFGANHPATKTCIKNLDDILNTI